MSYLFLSTVATSYDVIKRICRITEYIESIRLEILTEDSVGPNGKAIALLWLIFLIVVSI